MNIIYLVIYSVVFLIGLVNSVILNYSVLTETFGFKPDSVVIDLRNKNIEEIEDATFNGFNSLETLYLDENNLTKLNFEFSNLKNLSEIWFEFNYIVSVQKYIFKSLNNLKRVCFSENPISKYNPVNLEKLCDNKCDIKIKETCKRVLKGHTGQVFSLVDLKDKKSFASASADKKIRIWNYIGDSSKELIGHSDSVYSIAISNTNPNRLASSSYDSTVRIWYVSAVSDISALQPIQTLTGHTDSVRCLAFLPDGSLASGSNDETIMIWNINTGELINKLVGHEYLVISLTVIQNSFLVSGSYKEIRIWNVSSGETVQKLNGHTSYVWSLIELSGNRLASGSIDGSIKIWDLNTFQTIKILKISGTMSSPYVYSLLDLNKGKQLAAGYSDSVIRIWDLSSGNVIRSLLSDNSSSVNCLALLSGISKCIFFKVKPSLFKF